MRNPSSRAGDEGVPRARDPLAASRGLSWAAVILGSVMAGVAINGFFAPAKMVTGGVGGLAVLLFHWFHFPIYETAALFNIPLFFLGVRVLEGREFAVKTVAGVAVLIAVLRLTAGWTDRPLTDDPLLAGLYGGLLLGTGLGLVFRGRASTGGTDLLARVIQVWTGRSAGKALLGIDGAILAAGGFVFGWERAMYALIGLYATSRMIDVVQEGWRQARAVWIVSGRHREIQGAILKELDRGVTRIVAEGGFTGADRPVLFCVIRQGEVGRLKELLYRVDPGAFVVVAEVREVLGEGFDGRIFFPGREKIQ